MTGDAVGRRSIARFLRDLPKVELHVHLEGSMRPPTLLRLARRRGVALPATDEAGLRRWFRFRDFPHFVEVYLTCSSCLVEPEDFHELALDFLREQARQGVVYSEVHFTISTHLAAGGDGEGIRQALAEAGREGERRHGTRVAWIPDIVRNQDLERAERTVEWALAGRGRGVIALGIAGIEQGYSNEPFAPCFEEAARGGLRRVAHAGEHGGPDSIRSALDRLGAERIGHGVAAIEDAELTAELVRRGVALEVCPSSNVCLGVAASFEEHPFDRLRRAGLRVTVSSDDPPFFDTTLLDEYLRLRAAFGYDLATLARLVRASVEASFLDRADKARLGRRIEERTAAFEEATRHGA